MSTTTGSSTQKDNGSPRRGHQGQKKGGFYVLATVEVAGLVFEGGDEKFPDRRTATLHREQIEDQIPTVEDIPRVLTVYPYPATMFRPRAGRPYDCRVMILQKRAGDRTRFHVVASPIVGTQVFSAAEFLQARQTILRKVVFEEMGRQEDDSTFLAFQAPTGVFYIPSETWAEEMKAIYVDEGLPPPAELEPKPGVEYTGIPREFPNRVVVHPLPPANFRTAEKACNGAVATAEQLTEWHALNLRTRSGEWHAFWRVLELPAGPDGLTPQVVNAAATRIKKQSHPDRFKVPALKVAAQQKFELVEAARKMAIEWPQKKRAIEEAKRAAEKAEAEAEGRAARQARVAATAISRHSGWEPTASADPDPNAAG